MGLAEEPGGVRARRISRSSHQWRHPVAGVISVTRGRRWRHPVAGWAVRRSPSTVGWPSPERCSLMRDAFIGARRANNSGWTTSWWNFMSICDRFAAELSATYNYFSAMQDHFQHRYDSDLRNNRESCDASIL